VFVHKFGRFKNNGSMYTLDENHIGYKELYKCELCRHVSHIYVLSHLSQKRGILYSIVCALI
jgi:hypothetical protein